MEEYTRDREKELFRQAQAGDQASLNTLMQKHERLVHTVVRRQWSGGWRSFLGKLESDRVQRASPDA